MHPASSAFEDIIKQAKIAHFPLHGACGRFRCPFPERDIIKGSALPLDFSLLLKFQVMSYDYESMILPPFLPSFHPVALNYSIIEVFHMNDTAPAQNLSWSSVRVRAVWDASHRPSTSHRIAYEPFNSNRPSL